MARVDEPEKVAEIIVDSLNCMSLDESAIGREIANAHPTLQQSAMRMVVGFIVEMAQKTYTDARNQASVELAKKLAEQVDENTYLPLI